jgi:hypothetical protein
MHPRKQPAVCVVCIAALVVQAATQPSVPFQTHAFYDTAADGSQSMKWLEEAHGDDLAPLTHVAQAYIHASQRPANCSTARYIRGAEAYYAVPRQGIGGVVHVATLGLLVSQQRSAALRFVSRKGLTATLAAQTPLTCHCFFPCHAHTFVQHRVNTTPHRQRPPLSLSHRTRSCSHCGASTFQFASLASTPFFTPGGPEYRAYILVEHLSRGHVCRPGDMSWFCDPWGLLLGAAYQLLPSSVGNLAGGR